MTFDPGTVIFAVETPQLKENVMGKAHRGKGLKTEYVKGARGTCPITKRSGVKLLYEHEIDGNKVMISKIGRATLANKKKEEEKKTAEA